MAWELKKYFELQKKNDYHVFLEYPSQDKDRKRDGVAVELKNQAAQDLGRYDFLKDVMRIESFEENNPNKKLDCGYAVLLANDSTYWEREGSTTLYRDFSLYNKREIPNTSLKWNWKDEVKESKQIIIFGFMPCRRFFVFCQTLLHSLENIFRYERWYNVRHGYIAEFVFA